MNRNRIFEGILNESRYQGARLNSKQVTSKVKAYLEEENEMTIKDMYNQFESEYGWAIPRMGKMKAITEWLRGLPLSCAFYYNDIVKLMAEWTGDSEENQMKYIEDKGDEIYWVLLAREVAKGEKDK